MSNVRVAVLVEVPLAYYQGFIGRCELESREYHVLRNGIIGHVPEYLRDGNVTTLLCSEDVVSSMTAPIAIDYTCPPTNESDVRITG